MKDHYTKSIFEIAEAQPLTAETMKSIRERCVLHHTAWGGGYVSRKSLGKYAKYEGKFGRGYKVFLPSTKSTAYCPVEYYILPETADDEIVIK